MTEEKKVARLINKKPLNSMKKFKRKTKRFLNKVIDRKIVNKKPFNLIGNWRKKSDKSIDKNLSNLDKISKKKPIITIKKSNF